MYLLGLPKANAELELEHIFETNVGEAISKVSIVGSKTKLKWNVNEDKLLVTSPDASEMDEIATVFKVEFK